MSRIFISGGGHAKDSYLLDREFVRSLRNNNILYIPVGLERSIAGYDGCFEWLSETLAAHSKEELKISMWINLENLDRVNVVEYGAIYIGGALNTYKLMKAFLEYAIDEILDSYLEGPGSLYGGSSGGIVFGRNISTFEEENDVARVGEEGLDLVGSYSIYCHLTDNKISQVVQFSKENRTPVIAMPENSGVVLEDGIAEVIGYSKILVLKESEPDLFYFEPGERFRL
ncbi:MAG: Type 1 glutamine amidotransferase-like domain-containing protein [Patescibacteria group bacterium]